MQIFPLTLQNVYAYNARMITKQELLEYLGGTHSSVARKLGYTGKRADNNIIRLPDILTNRQRDIVFMRMKAMRIKIPLHWCFEKLISKRDEGNALCGKSPD